MAIKYHWLFFCMYLLIFVDGCFGLDVYVNNQNGTDQENCKSTTAPCKTISYAYKQAMKNATMTDLNLLLQGDYTLEETIQFNVSHDVLNILRLAPSEKSVQIIGGSNNTIWFGCEINNCVKYSFLVENLIFVGFNGITAINATNVDEIIVRKCKFIGNHGSAIIGVDAGVTVEECIFEWNYGICELIGPYGGMGGAVGFVFKHFANLSASIKNSDFNYNSACLDTVMNARLFNPSRYFRFYGGAITLVYQYNTSGNTISIDGCRFHGNKALFGGALYVSFADKCKNNTLSVSNSVFDENIALTSGGSFAIKTYDRSSAYSITFRNVSFYRNVARRSGGAGKIIFQTLDRHPLPLHFSNVSFIENRAIMDGALGIGSNLRNLRIKDRNAVYFENVEFIRNAFYMENTSFYYTGALQSFWVDLRFMGTVLFAENTINSALYLSGAFVEIDGNVTFYRNIARSNGAGISLTDGSTLLLRSGSSILFHMNFAWMNGGAIYYETSSVDNEVYSYNPICFLQYEKIYIPASQWNVSMKFIRNGAGVNGAAIYASTVRQCVWTEEYPFISYSKAFRWSDRFYYFDNYIGYIGESKMRKIGAKIDIATDVLQFIYNGSKTVTAQPGDNINIDITAVDEYQQDMSSLAIMTYSTLHKNGTPAKNIAMNTDDPLMYVSSGKNSSFSFAIASKFAYYEMKKNISRLDKEVDIVAIQSVFGARINMKLNPQLCNLGYKFDTEKLKCVCDLDIMQLKWCDNNMLHIEMGYWANRSQNNPDRLITFICPNRHCACNHDIHERNCQFITSDPNKQCIADREGTLCGQCKDGKSISLPSYSCKTCNSRALSIFTLIVVIIMVIGICIAIIYFNPVFSDYLKGVFFYTQILPYLFTGNDISQDLALRFSILINSVAVGSMPIEICLFDGLDLIEAVFLSYVMPLSAALVLIIVYILSKYRILTFRRDSPFGAFWILIAVVYKFLTETSLLSLACFRVDDELVFFFDGSQKCFVGKHLALFIPSVLILVFIVLPLPIVIVLISYGYIRVPPHISDVIARGYRTKYRWWCAVDFGRRLLFSAIVVFTTFLELRKALLIFASVLTCLSHTLILPYENRYANKGEAFLLACLTLISGLQAMEMSNVQTTGSIIVVSATIIYTGFVIIYLTYNKVNAWCKRRKALTTPNDRSINQHASPIDVTGKPYNIPKRVFLANRKTKKSRNFGKNLQEPLV